MDRPVNTLAFERSCIHYCCVALPRRTRWVRLSPGALPARRICAHRIYRTVHQRTA